MSVWDDWLDIQESHIAKYAYPTLHRREEVGCYILSADMVHRVWVNMPNFDFIDYMSPIFNQASKNKSYFNGQKLMVKYEECGFCR